MKKDTLIPVFIIVVVIAVIGVSAAYIWMNNPSWFTGGSPMTNDTTDATSTTTTTDDGAAAATESSSGFSPNKTTPKTQTANYQQVLEKYRDRRIQVANCTVDPYRVTYKNGTEIMIDNRSEDPQEIRLNTRIIRLQGYEYKIVKLTSAKLPATISVDCEMLAQPAYNVGTILLQP